MPIKKKADLPKQIKDNLPSHAEEVWKEAYNSAEEQYADPDERRDKSEDKETVAAKVAWSAVKKAGYKKVKGEWKKKDDN